ncbi:protein of unknown function [Actinacidiphila rubida]|uniref:Rv2525c-like glycoside hydrolase-like domain-containing protein n=2 Tax=Actinacidiphila rubida TaxID=310780 RepID=A0A1H8QTI0_9ACTN|nr:DUF1906 domain-containing protein [Actinacidiphila rubida]SEO57251.1 protein of unknown function [Actinacidiphila rubida]
MTEKITFVRSLLAGALTLTGLLSPVLGTPSAAAPAGPPPARPAARAAQQAPAAVAHRGGRGHHRITGTRLFRGEGFDTCQAPGLATMDAWRAHSAYRAVGVYFGGRARACSSQRNLTPDWVRQTTADGWNLLPVYVGSQAPCVGNGAKGPFSIDSSRPASQGTSEAEDAVGAAQALGIQPGSPLYLDMETYDLGNSACKATTLSYVRAWDRQVHAAGYVAGFYSSADSGVRHMDQARAAGYTDLPDVLWYGRWGVAPDLASDPAVSDAAWTPHARIHQYQGSVTETHGGRRLTVDRNLIDAPVAVVG